MGHCVGVTEKNKTKKKGVRQFLTSSSYQYKLPQTHTYIPKFQFPIMPYLNSFKENYQSTSLYMTS